MYRRHSDEYKRRIVTEYEGLPAGGSERGSMLRREGLARTQVYEWRKTYAIGCAHLFWPHLIGLCSSDLAPPG